MISRTKVFRPPHEHRLNWEQYSFTTVYCMVSDQKNSLEMKCWQAKTRIISSWYCKNGSLRYLFCVSQNLVKLGGGAHKKLGMEGWKRNRVNGVTGIDFFPLVDAENLNPVAWLQNREIVLSPGVSRSLQGNNSDSDLLNFCSHESYQYTIS